VRTVAEHLRAIANTPLPDEASVTLPVATLRAWLADEPDACASGMPEDAAPALSDWRERLWTCPDSVRLGVPEVAEALDRSPDWVYRAVSAKQAAERERAPLPCSRLDGVLVFTAGAVRRWVEVSAVIVNAEHPAARLRLSRPGRPA
jgi:hypothetical protein